jgi:Predicted xylanase/chitin deacetylase
MKKSNKAVLLTAASAGLAYGIIPTLVEKTKYRTSSDRSEKIIYLTFDDGPSEYTNELLDLLNKYDVKASFFMVGLFVSEYPEVVKRVHDEGHLIGIHSLEHRSALLCSPAYTNRDFQETLTIMGNLGVEPKYYRGPWGEVNLWSIMNTNIHGLERVEWNVMAEDWRGDTTADIIAEKLIDRTKNGDVVCLHDGRGKNEAPARTIAALRKVLPQWIDEGFKFRLISERTMNE